MDPQTVRRQTVQIVRCLLDDSSTESRRGDIEHDGPGGDDDQFDPVIIAGKLKAVADKLQHDTEFQAALREFQQASTKQAILSAFSQGVQTLCQPRATGAQAEVAPEMQLIRASVSLGMYIKQKSPELISKLEDAIGTFLNTRVGDWVGQQGGWDAVANA